MLVYKKEREKIMDYKRTFNERIEIKILVIIAVHFGIVFAVSLFGGVLFALLGVGLESPTSIMVFQTIFTASTTIPFTIWFIKDNKSNKTEFKPRKGDIGVVCIICILVAMYMASLAGNGLLFVTGVYDAGDSYQEATEIFTQSPFFLEILAVVILAPIGEEVLFRGLIFKNLRRKYNFWICAIVTTVLFTAAHMDIYQGLAIFPISILWAYLYEKFGRIWIPIVAHMWNNLLATVMVKLLGTSTAGEDISTGVGEELTDASIMLSGFIVLLIGGGILFLMIFCLYKSKYPRGEARLKLMKPVLIGIDAKRENRIKKLEEKQMVDKANLQ